MAESSQNDVKKVTINVLPNEILCKVFSFLSVSDLIFIARLVCSRWYNVTFEKDLWTKLTSDDIRSLQAVKCYSHCCLACILKHLYTDSKSNLRLKHLSLDHDHVPLISERLDSSKDVSVLFPWISYLESLNELSLACCTLETSLIEMLLGAIASFCPKLNTLNLEGSNVSDHGFDMLHDCDIIKLDVTCCSSLTGTFLYKIGHWNLRHLNIDGVQWIGDEAIGHFLYLCQHSLQYLWLDGEKLTDKGLQHIEHCFNMRVLKISFCEELTDLTLSRISNLPKLMSLSLRKGKKFSKDGFIFMLRNFQRGIVYLDLSECVVLDNEVVDIFTQVFPNLTKLNLSWCWSITDEGLQYIVNRCCNIQELILIGLDEITGKPLRNVLKKMRRLYFLDLTSCTSIVDDIIKEIARKRLSLEIFDYYGNVVK